MQVHIYDMEPLAQGSQVPPQYLNVDAETGVGARINAGMCLLSPDPALLELIRQEVDASRELSRISECSRVVDGVFEGRWRPSWTPEEDGLTRAVCKWRSSTPWTHLGSVWNYEVMQAANYFPGLEPEAQDREELDFKQAAVYHFSGADKPTWWVWEIRWRDYTIPDICYYIREEHARDDPRGFMATATGEWLTAYQEMEAHARDAWQLDILELVGWSNEAPKSRGKRTHKQSFLEDCEAVQGLEVQMEKRAKSTEVHHVAVLVAT